MTPILVSKVRGLQATQEAPVPGKVDLRGASRVGKATWVALEKPDRSLFLKCTAVSTE